MVEAALEAVVLAEEASEVVEAALEAEALDEEDLAEEELQLEEDGADQDGEGGAEDQDGEEEDGGSEEAGDVVHGEETGGEQEDYGGDDLYLLANHTGLTTDSVTTKEELTGKFITELIDL